MSEKGKDIVQAPRPRQLVDFDRVDEDQSASSGSGRVPARQRSRLTKSKNSFSNPIPDLSENTQRPIAPSNRAGSTLFQSPSNDFVSNDENFHCPDIANHSTGIFCTTCRTQPMEWATGDLPYVADDEGRILVVGPEMSMVQDVQLQNKEAVAVMSLVAYFDVFNKRYSDIGGLVELMGKYTESIEAGQRIADIYQELRRRAFHRQDQCPNFHEVIHAALLDPCLRADQYELEVMKTFVPLPRDKRSDIIAQGELEDSGGQDSLDIVRDPESDLLMKSRPILTQSNSHRPGPRAKKGDWQFVEGTDLSDAVLGKPEPHKFFLIREKISDPTVLDCREYPGWREDFDWDNQTKIDALNKHRHQIKYRLNGAIADSRPSWTKAEKDALEELLREEVNAGKSWQTIGWKDVSERLTKAFQGVVQAKGKSLAPISIWEEHKKQCVFPEAGQLSKNRTEPAVRTPSAVETQVGKYHDLRVLIGMSAMKKLKKERKRKRESDETESTLVPEKSKVAELTIMETNKDENAFPSSKKTKKQQKEIESKSAKEALNRPRKSSRSRL